MVSRRQLLIVCFGVSCVRGGGWRASIPLGRSSRRRRLRCCMEAFCIRVGRGIGKDTAERVLKGMWFCCNEKVVNSLLRLWRVRRRGGTPSSELGLTLGLLISFQGLPSMPRYFFVWCSIKLSILRAQERSDKPNQEKKTNSVAVSKVRTCADIPSV